MSDLPVSGHLMGGFLLELSYIYPCVGSHSHNSCLLLIFSELVFINYLGEMIRVKDCG